MNDDDDDGLMMVSPVAYLRNDDHFSSMNQLLSIEIKNSTFCLIEEYQ